jgi:hypothetical protein
LAVSDTGESTAEINRRDDRENWEKIRPLLEGGWHLRHGGRGLRRYYTVAPNGDFGQHGLRQEKVRQLERDGVLALVGSQTYALKARPA